MLQKEFLNHLKSELADDISLNDAVATALDISYDAAHRRTSLKSKFSMDEAICLAKYYNLSLDRLFETTEDEIISVQKTKSIQNETELKLYFDNSFASLQPLLNQKESRIIYSAKDLPLFYTLDSDLLSRFKMYVWLKLLDPSMETKSFDAFSLKVSTIDSAKALGGLYKNLNTTEIWDVTTVNSTLKQIHFFNQAGRLSNVTALKLCVDLKTLIVTISDNVRPNSSDYQFYYNELLLMNNNVMVKTPTQKSLFVPFTILSYFQTSDKLTCHQAEEFLNKQLQSSKLLNTAGEKEKLTFFNKIYAKIDALHKIIDANQVLGFE